MTLFFIYSLGLTVLALLFILVPLLRYQTTTPLEDNNQANLTLFRHKLDELQADLGTGILDQQQYATARRDLEKSLALDLQAPQPATAAITPKSGRWAIPVLAVIIPLFTIGLYLTVGDYQAMAPQTAEAAVDSASHEAAMPSMDTMRALVDRLEEKMQSRPDDLEGWKMLGRSSLVLGQTQRAVTAYAQAYRLAPKEPMVMLAYADAMSQLTQGFDAQSIGLIQEVLAMIPDNPQALWLMGLAEFQRDGFAKAIEYWGQLATKLPQDSKEMTTLRRLIDAAKQRNAPATTIPP